MKHAGLLRFWFQMFAPVGIWLAFGALLLSAAEIEARFRNQSVPSLELSVDSSISTRPLSNEALEQVARTYDIGTFSIKESAYRRGRYKSEKANRKRESEGRYRWKDPLN
jgi:hypothetical protein